MADSTTPPVVNPTDPPQGDKTDNAIPYARFKEVNDKAKALQDQLDAIKLADEKKKQDELVSQKKFEELATQKEAELQKEREKSAALAEKAKKADEQEKVLRDQAMAKLTDDTDKAIAAELSTPSLLRFVESKEKQTHADGSKRPPLKDGEKPTFKNMDDVIAYGKSQGLV